ALPGQFQTKRCISSPSHQSSGPEPAPVHDTRAPGHNPPAASRSRPGRGTPVPGPVSGLHIVPPLQHVGASAQPVRNSHVPSTKVPTLTSAQAARLVPPASRIPQVPPSAHWLPVPGQHSFHSLAWQSASCSQSTADAPLAPCVLRVALARSQPAPGERCTALALLPGAVPYHSTHPDTRCSARSPRVLLSPKTSGGALAEERPPHTLDALVRLTARRCSESPLLACACSLPPAPLLPGGGVGPVAAPGENPPGRFAGAPAPPASAVA